MQKVPKNTSYQTASSVDKLCERMYAGKSQKDSTSEKLSDNFLKNRHESQIAPQYNVKEAIYKIQHRHHFQRSSETPVFFKQKCI